MDSYTELNKIEDLRNAYFVINVIYIVTMVIGFFGNILIVSTILKNKYLRTPMNISLVSLALCDIVVCVCVLPVRLFLYSSTFSATYTHVLCRVDVFLKSLCDYVQPTMLVATSYERYKSIAKPFQSKSKMKRTVILISATWGTCICCGAVSAVLLKDGATIVPCNKDIITAVYSGVSVVNYREAYVTFPLGFTCIIIVSIFYYLMIRTLHQHSNKMKKQFKTKSFKNKVHPDPKTKTDQTVTKDLNLETLTVQPLVVEKSEAINLSDNSGQTSGTTIQTPDSAKTFSENTNLTTVNTDDLEKKDQSLKVEDAIHNETETVTPDSNSDCQKAEDVSPDVALRRISIRKTRDNILFPSNERATMRRFSTIAKHVVLLKSHKKKSLKNMQDKIAKLALNTSRKSSVISQESKTTVIDIDDNKSENKIDTDEDKNESVKTLGSNSANVKGETLSFPNKNEQGNEADNVSLINAETIVAESGNQRLIDEQTHVASALTDAEKYAETGDDKLTFNATSEQNLKGIDVSDKSSPAGNSNICNIRITSCENNEMVTPIDVKMKENKDELSGNVSVVGSNEQPVIKTDSPKSKNKISNVDIVDFDGTVHKDVKVEGAVVGAVCVMNKTNRLEGRRKVEMRAAKRIAVLMGSFVLLWLPLPLIALFVSSRRQISTNDIEALITSASISATTIAFNPILNLLLNKQLRSAALTLLRRVVNTLKRLML